MIKGNIAIPSVDPKSWRSKGRKRRPQPAIASVIVTPAPMKKRHGPVIRLSEQQQANNTGQEQPRRSAIVEPKLVPSNAMLEHLLDHDGSEAEHRRRGELADKLFQTIVRRAAANRK
jgi:hypothetical protein